MTPLRTVVLDNATANLAAEVASRHSRLRRGVQKLTFERSRPSRSFPPVM